jgi:DNA-binding GntR family transcriptional regulator
MAMDRQAKANGPKSVKLRAVTTAARIYEALHADIITMRLPPGATLVEKDLCQTYGVSRTPVREALLRLAEEQLIDIYPQIGTFVSRIAAPAVRDAMAMRKALEAVTAEHAALGAEPAELVALRRLIARQKECASANDFDAFHAADEALHQTIAEIAGHPNFWRVIKREKAQIDRFRLLTLPIPQRPTRVIAEHEAIVEAIAKRDPQAAITAMRSHLESVLPVFDEIRAAHPDFFEPEPETQPARLVAR